MASNQLLTFVKDLFGKAMTVAEKKLPAYLLFPILALIIIIVALIAMAILRVDLKNNIFWLIAIVVVGALIGSFIIELRGQTHGSSSVAVQPSPELPPVPAQTQTIIYDSAKSSSIAFDFKGMGSPIFEGRGKEARPITPTGRGRLGFEEGGILNVYRENTDGRFEIRPQRYSYRGTNRQYLPKNISVGAPRKLELRFEAKVSKGAQHTLKAVLKNEETERWLATAEITVTENNWSPFQLFLLADDPLLDCHLRIDDQDVSTAPSSVQLRSILFVEHPE